MDILIFTVVATMEVVALRISILLWFPKRQMKVIPRIFWSILLLVPFFGLLLYVFLLSDLEKNPDRMDTPADRDAFIGGGGDRF